MPHLQLTADQVRSKLFSISSLQEKEREEVAELMMAMSLSDAWFPDALRRKLHDLQDKGAISETDRHAVEKAFFPDHTW